MMKALSFILIFSSLLTASYAGETGKKLLQTVPDIEQSTDYSCGVSSLVGVLAYYGKQATEAELMAETKIDPEAGVAISDLIKASEIRGIKAVAVENAKIKDLEEAVMRGQLTIILGQAWRVQRRFRYLTPWGDEWNSGHYMVIIGIDETSIYFEDPWLLGVRGFISKEEFQERWHGPSDLDVPTQRQAVFFNGIPDMTREELKLKSVHVN